MFPVPAIAPASLSVGGPVAVLGVWGTTALPFIVLTLSVTLIVMWLRRHKLANLAVGVAVEPMLQGMAASQRKRRKRQHKKVRKSIVPNSMVSVATGAEALLVSTSLEAQEVDTSVRVTELDAGRSLTGIGGVAVVSDTSDFALASETGAVSVGDVESQAERMHFSANGDHAQMMVEANAATEGCVQKQERCCAISPVWGSEERCTYSRSLLLAHREIRHRLAQGPPGLELDAEVAGALEAGCGVGISVISTSLFYRSYLSADRSAFH